MLFLKPWHPSFDPSIEYFDHVPLWVRLPNLCLQYWFDFGYELLRNSLVKFLMVDERSLNVLHSTYAWILVEIDITENIPKEIFIKSLKNCCMQSLDYDGIPFRCRKII